jgi:hypothetical protein
MNRCLLSRHVMGGGLQSSNKRLDRHPDLHILLLSELCRDFS